jgi:hypothetical protein
MKAGNLINVTIVDDLGNNKFEVIEKDSGLCGTLSVKGRLKKQKDGSIKAWVIDFYEQQNKFYCGNAYFGKYSISEGISKNYIRIISNLYKDIDEIEAEDLSTLKGMANRCLKFDQWDWLTTYQYLGYPNKPYLREFVKETIVQRDKLRESDKSLLNDFASKYSFMLNSMLFHLNQKSNIEYVNYSKPTDDFDQTLWDKLTPDSKENITLVTKLLNSESVFLLMHFFVVLEQEFLHNFIEPFIESLSNEIKESSCDSEKFLRTHKILSGKEHFSLGSIMFIGKLVTDRKALETSIVINEFNKFLGIRVTEFRKLCFEINDYRVNNLSLTKMRNGIAHGDSKVIHSIDSKCYNQIYSLFFKKPTELIIKILSNSMK